MANHHLRNRELSLKAKGLLSLMLSLPEDWDYTTKGLSCICKDGVDSICATIKELEKAGYVKRRRLRDAQGRLSDLESRADMVLEEQRRALRETPVYPFPASYAQEHGELEQYRASNRANAACKEAIEAAIREHYDGNSLDSQAAELVVEAFGLDRTLYVLANTVQQKDWDGRISSGNKAWAKTIPIHKNPDAWGADRNASFVVNSHPGLTDLFLSTVRQEYCQKQEKSAKSSVREKLQAMPKATSPKHSAKLKRQER